jgi:hypothetical protein
MIFLNNKFNSDHPTTTPFCVLRWSFADKFKCIIINLRNFHENLFVCLQLPRLPLRKVTENIFSHQRKLTSMFTNSNFKNYSCNFIELILTNLRSPKTIYQATTEKKDNIWAEKGLESKKERKIS